MKLYADYLKETEDVDCIYTDDFFMFYKLEPKSKSAFILDVYSKPEIRGKGIVVGEFKKLVVNLKELGYNYIFSNTCTIKCGYQRSDAIHLQFGFKYIGLDPKDNTMKQYFLQINGE